MSQVALTGNDIITINDNLISDLADGVVGNLTFDTDLATLNVGKNGNAIYTFNESGKVGVLELRVLRGSGNDIYLNSLVTLLERDSASFPLIYGQFVKRIGDGNGNVKKDTYNMTGGIFTRKPGVQEDKSGGTDQAVSVYTITFANAPRTLG